MSHEPRRAGRHFLQIPGPTPVPERILAAMSRQILDHRGLEFQRLGKRVLSGIKGIFKTQGSSSRRRALAPGNRRCATRCLRATRF